MLVDYGLLFSVLFSTLVFGLWLFRVRTSGAPDSSMPGSSVPSGVNSCAGVRLFQGADTVPGSESLRPRKLQEMHLGIQHSIGGFSKYVRVVNFFRESDRDGYFDPFSLFCHRSNNRPARARRQPPSVLDGPWEAPKTKAAA